MLQNNRYLIERIYAKHHQDLYPIDIGCISNKLLSSESSGMLSFIIYDFTTNTRLTTNVDFLKKNAKQIINKGSIILPCDMEIYKILQLLTYTQNYVQLSSSSPYLNLNKNETNEFLKQGYKLNLGWITKSLHDVSYYSIIDYLYNAMLFRKTNLYGIDGNLLVIRFYEESVYKVYEYEISDVGKFTKYISYLGGTHDFIENKLRLQRRI